MSDLDSISLLLLTIGTELVGDSVRNVVDCAPRVVLVVLGKGS